MSDSITVNPTPTTLADVHKVYTSSSWLDVGTLAWGGTAKGIQNVSAWILFEPNLPAGSTIVSVELNFYMQTLSAGTLDQTFSIGYLSPDGTWDVQPTDAGWGEYPVTDPTTVPSIHPSRNNTSDPKWVNNFPSFYTNFIPGGSPAPPPSGTFFSFGGGSGITPTYASADFATDAQTIFDLNEPNRTARGVPIAIHINPFEAADQQWAVISNEGVTPAQRPNLVLVYNPPPIAAELSSNSSLDASVRVDFQTTAELLTSAVMDAEAGVSRVGASELQADTTLDAAAELVLFSSAELSSASVLDANTILGLQIVAQLLTTTVLDVDAIILGNIIASELSAQTTLDAETRDDAVADAPLQITVLPTVASVIRASANLNVTRKSANAQVVVLSPTVQTQIGTAIIEITRRNSTVQVSIPRGN